MGSLRVGHLTRCVVRCYYQERLWWILFLDGTTSAKPGFQFCIFGAHAHTHTDFYLLIRSFLFKLPVEQLIGRIHFRLSTIYVVVTVSVFWKSSLYEDCYAFAIVSDPEMSALIPSCLSFHICKMYAIATDQYLVRWLTVFFVSKPSHKSYTARMVELIR